MDNNFVFKIPEDISDIVPIYRFGTKINKSYDLMIIAPLRVGWGLNYIEGKSNIKVKKTFTFYETAELMLYLYDKIPDISDAMKYPIRMNNNILVCQWD